MASQKRYVPGMQRELERWIRERCAEVYQTSGVPIERVRIVRTSSRSVSAWQESATTTYATIDRQDPDVAQALELGFDVVRRDVIGDSCRDRLGADVFVVRENHAPGGQTTRQVGVLLRVGTTIFIYLLASARAGNLSLRLNL